MVSFITQHNMYNTVLIIHSLLRWLVLLALFTGIFCAWRGYSQSRAFTNVDNAIRHWTATIAHIQLIFGIVLFSRSPVALYFWSNFSTSFGNMDLVFFGFIHTALMLLAIVLLTIGSAAARRKARDSEKFRTMLIFFSIALLVILIAIPWPFSPLATRPWFRPL